MRDPESGEHPTTGDGRADGRTGPCDGPSPGRAALLAPFVAWMATQPIDEVSRRRHRRTVAAYLEWCRTDDGPTTGRRRRYEDGLGRGAPVRLDQARAGLDHYAHYREVIARTQPADR